MDPDIAAQFKHLQDALEATIKRLTDAKAKNVAQNTKIAALDAKAEEQNAEIQELKAWKASVEASTPQEAPILSWVKRWRLLMVAGGLFTPGLAVAALMEKSKDALTAEKLSWASYSFGVFSFTCLTTAAGGNVRSIGSRVDKSVMILIGLLAAAVHFFPGYALAGYGDQDTAAKGKGIMSYGVLFAIILPPIF